MSSSTYPLAPHTDTLHPLLVPSGIAADVLAAYLGGARSAAADVSATFNNNLTTLAREYSHRKSYSFDALRQPQAHAVLHALLMLTKAHAPTLWSNPELTDPATNWHAAHPQGLKYVVGGKFFAHADDRVRVAMTAANTAGAKAGERRWVRNRPERQIVAILYLNDDYEGGELYFPTLTGNDDDAGKPLRLKPKAGEVVIFGGDDRYLHGVDEVTVGERYCVTLWTAPLPQEPAQTVADAQRLYDQEINQDLNQAIKQGATT
jgi:predicted 2-oxoglutarate/Fe(II)-dependent dioxygenase YbiX